MSYALELTLALLALLPFVLIGAVLPADRWSDKLLARVKNSAADWEAGVANPRRSPTAAMKAANGKWKANVQRAVNEDRWSRAVSALTDDAIKQAAARAGGQRFVDGVTTREAKIRTAIAKLQPKVAALSARVQSLPQDSDANREQRMIENLRGMRQLRGSASSA